MRKLSLLAGLALAAGCTPDIKQVAPEPAVVVRFDPAAVPPVVPSPNNLATDPKTGLLAVPLPPGASGIDKELVAYLNTLDGYPTDATAVATFDGALAGTPADLAAAVTVLDLADGKPVTDYQVEYQSTPHEAAASSIHIVPGPSLWKPGHSYAIALFGGDAGLKGEGGVRVLGSSTWALVRSKTTLVTCAKLDDPKCESVTQLIPSDKVDPAARLADQAQKAVQLERLRLKYATVLDAFVANGANRDDIALAWSFKTQSPAVTMGFFPKAAPPVVPVPNDLAIDGGVVSAPVDPAAPPAQQEFVRDWVNTLDGFPAAAPAGAVVVNGDLDGLSVGPSSVLVFDANDPARGMLDATIDYDATAHALSIAPPAQGWPKGGHIAVAVVAAAEGVNGVKAAGGGKVIPSEYFTLVRSPSPLVNCENLASPNCTVALTVAPISLGDALKLEAIRRGYSPILDGLEAGGVRRPNVLLLWTFQVMTGEATFDPANNVIPFPNNLLLSGGKVNLPVPAGASPLVQALIGGLNTLDGFSLSAPAVSENSDALGALDFGLIDPATLDGGTGFVKLTGGGTAPSVTACLGCRSSLLPDGHQQTGPQQLQFVPNVPLDEKATYAAFITTRVKDTHGNPVAASPAFALLRSSTPLVDADGKSLLSDVSDEKARRLEPARQAMKPLIDALAAKGVARKDLALAWAFTTQSVHTVLKALNTAPTQAGLAGVLPSTTDYLVDVTAQKPAAMVHVSKLYAGRIPSLFLLTGPGGTLNPTGPLVLRIPFTLTLPTGVAPGAGYPVVVFGHGLSGGRSHMLGIADAFAAAGFATIATDVVWHGDRSMCTGSKAATRQASDDASCADPVTQMCDAATGRCVARSGTTPCDPTSAGAGDLSCVGAGLGACIPDSATTGHCEGGDFKRDSLGVPVISGWNILNLTNLFATRDNFRQQVADLAQLARVIGDASGAGLNAKLAAAGAAAGLDPTQVNYAGQSLGGILGSLYASVAPGTHRVVLNVPGGDPVGILLDSPAFSAQRDGFLATLASQGMTQGTPGFDNFIGIARWILDAADPQNVGYQLTHGPTLPADRAVLIQYVKSDYVVPNTSTDRLIAGANRAGDPLQCLVRSIDPTVADLPPADRHGFLLNFANPAITAAAQTQAATFLKTGSVP